MSDSNVIPFRKRPPSETELEMYREITRNWSPQMRALMFPEHFRSDPHPPLCVDTSRNRER